MKIKLSFTCKSCSQANDIILDISEHKPRNLSPETREAMRRRALENLNAGKLGRPSGAKDLTPRKPRNDKGIKRGSMRRGADL